MIGLLVVAQLAVAAHGPDTATACTPFEISVAARAEGSVAPRITFPGAGPLELLRSTIRSHPERDATGAVTTVTEGLYVVAVHTIGRINIPSFVVSAGTRRATATAGPVDVSRDESPAPIVLVRAALDDGHGLVDSDSVWVGQQVDYVVDVQLNEAARYRMRRNPTFFPPEMPGVLAYDLEPPPPVGRAGPRCFGTLSYHRALFPLFPGAAVIPPAVLSYAIPVSTSFFSREESFEARTDSVRIVALEPPAANRPADFAGAVGRLVASARVDSGAARMGDPLVFTVRLEGSGNVKLLPRPALTLDWANVAAADERVVVDTTHAAVRGAKEFDWLVTPRRAGHQEIAAIRYPFFDPERAAYDSTRTAPIGLQVIAAPLVATDTVPARRLAIRGRLGEQASPPLTERPWFWALLAAAPFPATLRGVRRRARRQRAATPPAQRLQALASAGAAASAGISPRELRRLFVDTLRERVPGLALAGSRAPLARQLQRAGVTAPTAQRAEALMQRLDSAAFSSAGRMDDALVAEAAAVARGVSSEAVRITLPSRAATLSMLVLVAALSGGAATLHAARSNPASDFDSGVRAFDAGQPALAQRLFARAAAGAPRASNAWANLGTAAWFSGDSARAAFGWQRALRLDPLDDEVRGRLDALQPASFRSRGYVPAIPGDAVAWLALALWLGAWLALALPPARRPAWVRAAAGGSIAVAVVALLGALELHDRMQPGGLAVLRETRALLERPVQGTPMLAAGSVGEVGALDARDARWVHVTLDDSRAGWVPSSAVLPLDSPAGSN